MINVGPALMGRLSIWHRPEQATVMAFGGAIGPYLVRTLLTTGTGSGITRKQLPALAYAPGGFIRRLRKRL